MSAVDAGRATSATIERPGEPSAAAYRVPRLAQVRGRARHFLAHAREAAPLKEASPTRKCVETAITRLPPAEREEQLRRHGLDPSPRWSGVEGVYSVPSPVEGEFLRDGGWSIVDTTRGSHNGGAVEAGMTAHRGVLHSDEYVDHERLVGFVEDGLEHSFDDVHAVYRQGPLSDDQRELRGAIDARLLALSRAGANMVLLGYVLGLGVTPDGHCRAVQAAVARARAIEGAAS